MLKVNEDIPELRNKIIDLERKVAQNKLLSQIPSAKKKIDEGRFHFHCKDDHPEIRLKFLEFIMGIECSFQAIVGRKDYYYKKNKFNLKSNDLYTELLSHLIKDKFKLERKLVLNIASRGNSTSYNNLQDSLIAARTRFLKINSESDISANVVFNVQDFVNEPILSIVDYFCWSIQRVYEMGETRFYDFLFEKIRVVQDLWETEKYNGSKNYYKGRNRLTSSNKIKKPSLS